MKRLEILLLTLFIGTGLLTVGCGGSGTSAGTTPPAQPAASASAQASTPAGQPAASTQPATTSEPSQAGASDAATAPTQETATQEKPRFVPPVRGTADIEILPPQTKVEGSEVVTTLKIRNASRGAIAMLRVDETWYDKAGNAMPGDSQRYRKLFVPGEVIELVLRTPKNSKFYQNTFQFSHANGTIEVKTVKKFPEAAAK